MNDITRRLLTEYMGRVEHQFDLAMENWKYCRENANKYGGDKWQADVDKWDARIKKHRAKVLEIRQQLEA